jgi:hypothetical protein
MTRHQRIWLGIAGLSLMAAMIAAGGVWQP